MDKKLMHLDGEVLVTIIGDDNRYTNILLRAPDLIGKSKATQIDLISLAETERTKLIDTPREPVDETPDISNSNLQSRP